MKKKMGKHRILSIISFFVTILVIDIIAYYLFILRDDTPTHTNMVFFLLFCSFPIIIILPLYIVNKIKVGGPFISYFYDGFKTYNTIPKEELKNLVEKSLNLLGWEWELHSSKYQCKNKGKFSNMKEKISIEIRDDNSVIIESALPKSDLIDLGKNKENVENFFHTLDQLIEIYKEWKEAYN